MFRGASVLSVGKCGKGVGNVKEVARKSRKVMDIDGKRWEVQSREDHRKHGGNMKMSRKAQEYTNAGDPNIVEKSPEITQPCGALSVLAPSSRMRRQ